MYMSHPYKIILSTPEAFIQRAPSVLPTESVPQKEVMRRQQRIEQASFFAGLQCNKAQHAQVARAMREQAAFFITVEKRGSNTKPESLL